MVVDFNDIGTKVLSPKKLAHVVLRTNNFEKMSEFYKTFLGGRPSFENSIMSFQTYDEEHHRIALVSMPQIGGKNPMTSGLEHIAFTYDTLNDLLLSYRQRKNRNMFPSWCVNHGATVSIYYRDPDGNSLETQVDNFQTEEEVNEFLFSADFAINPIGVDFDPEEMIARLEAGEDEKVLRKREKIGPRGVDTVPMAPKAVAV